MKNAELIVECERQQRLLKLMIEKSKNQSRQNLTQQLEEILALGQLIKRNIEKKLQ